MRGTVTAAASIVVLLTTSLVATAAGQPMLASSSIRQDASISPSLTCRCSRHILFAFALSLRFCAVPVEQTLHFQTTDAALVDDSEGQQQGQPMAEVLRQGAGSISSPRRDVQGYRQDCLSAAGSDVPLSTRHLWHAMVHNIDLILAQTSNRRPSSDVPTKRSIRWPRRWTFRWITPAIAMTSSAPLKRSDVMLNGTRTCWWCGACAFDRHCPSLGRQGHALPQRSYDVVFKLRHGKVHAIYSEECQGLDEEWFDWHGQKKGKHGKGGRNGH